jgi:hypothetical protein
MTGASAARVMEHPPPQHGVALPRHEEARTPMEVRFSVDPDGVVSC